MIEQNVKQILAQIPAGATLVAAAKTRTPDEILGAIAAGITVIGETTFRRQRRRLRQSGKRQAGT